MPSSSPARSLNASPPVLHESNRNNGEGNQQSMRSITVGTTRNDQQSARKDQGMRGRLNAAYHTASSIVPGIENAVSKAVDAVVDYVFSDSSEKLSKEEFDKLPPDLKLFLQTVSREPRCYPESINTIATANGYPNLGTPCFSMTDMIAKFCITNEAYCLATSSSIASPPAINGLDWELQQIS